MKWNPIFGNFKLKKTSNVNFFLLTKINVCKSSKSTVRILEHSKKNINSQLWRRSTARGSSTRLVPVGPTRAKARKSILFTEGTTEVKMKLNAPYLQRWYIVCFKISNKKTTFDTIWVTYQKLLKAKARPSPILKINWKKGTEQLANLLKNIKVY